MAHDVQRQVAARIAALREECVRCTGSNEDELDYLNGQQLFTPEKVAQHYLSKKSRAISTTVLMNINRMLDNLGFQRLIATT